MLNRVKHLVSEQSSVNNSSTRILYNFQLSTYYSLLITHYLKLTTCQKVTNVTLFYTYYFLPSL